MYFVDTNENARVGVIMVVGDRFKIFLMAVRQALIIIIGATEDYLEMNRSIVPRHKKKKQEEEKGERISNE